VTLLPTPSAIVNNKTLESPGVRAKALADLRIVSRLLENATVLILKKNLQRPTQFLSSTLLSGSSLVAA
jgi:hypothetical protein